MLVLTAEEKKQMAQIAQGFDVPALIYNITALEKLRWTLRSSETSRALLEALVLRLALSEHFMSLTQLAGHGAAASGVKKKPINASNPSAQPAPAAFNRPAPQSPQVQATIESVQASWSMLIDAITQKDASLGTILRSANPVSLKNSMLEIQFGKDGQGQFAKSMCERKTPVIEEHFSQALGGEITIRFSETQAAPVTAPKKADGAPKADQAERNEVLNDPTVQMVLKGLDATPVEIKKVEIEEPEEPIEESVAE